MGLSDMVVSIVKLSGMDALSIFSIVGRPMDSSIVRLPGMIFSIKLYGQGHMTSAVRPLRAVRPGPYGQGRTARAAQPGPYGQGRTARAIRLVPYGQGRTAGAVRAGPGHLKTTQNRPRDPFGTP